MKHVCQEGLCLSHITSRLEVPHDFNLLPRSQAAIMAEVKSTRVFNLLFYRDKACVAILSVVYNEHIGCTHYNVMRWLWCLITSSVMRSLAMNIGTIQMRLKYINKWCFFWFFPNKLKPHSYSLCLYWLYYWMWKLISCITIHSYSVMTKSVLDQVFLWFSRS